MNATPFVWPLSAKCSPPDEMNTSYGPRIDADRWDFHDGIDLPAPGGTPVHAMANGTVFRAGPADKTSAGLGFGSTHILLRVQDPADGQDDLFLVYLHLDSIAAGVIPGATVQQGDVIGAVGQEDATYPHLHFEFRKGDAREASSVHPLRYLPYVSTANFTQLRVDRCNFYRVANEDRRAVRLRFDVTDRREGDVHGVDVELGDPGGNVLTFHVNFDDRATIVSDKGDEHAFKNGIAVEGYQKSSLKAEAVSDLRYGVIVRDITSAFTSVKLQVIDVQNGPAETATFPLPTLEAGEQRVNSREDFEGQTFPPPGWALQLLPGNVCQADPAAALVGTRGLLCQDLLSPAGPLIRAGLRFELPDRAQVRPMSWRLRAAIRPAELVMEQGLVIHPLAFLIGDDVVAAACLRKIHDDRFIAGVLIRGADGLVRETIDVTEGEIFIGSPVPWELELLRVGTRQTTAVVRLNSKVVARINGDTTTDEPDAAFVGMLHRHGGLQITLHVDQLFLTEALR